MAFSWTAARARTWSTVSVPGGYNRNSMVEATDITMWRDTARWTTG
jgi:hypothetical protein